jgi:lysophospholipid acyltransferase (LPLAT)-like uncharacterized protein
MPAVQDDGGGLRNTIYEQKTSSGRRLTRARRLLYGMLVPLARQLLRLVWGWCRIARVEGAENIGAALLRAPSFIPVYWHQHQLFCVRQLLDCSGLGVRLGFLISPSVDGEIGAMLVRSMGAVAIRGSSTHTGARALRDYYQALVHEAVSPAITPDGPRGPVWKAKPGAILLAQMSQRPVIPMAYAASHAWTIQWDRFVIPWPFARIAIVVGEPLYIPRGLDASALERHQADLEQRLHALADRAKAILASNPANTKA